MKYPILQVKHLADEVQVRQATGQEMHIWLELSKNPGLAMHL